MKRNYTEFLQDILHAITEIGLFVNGASYEAFESNREKTLAVVKLLEVIGEAVKKIPNDFFKTLFYTAITAFFRNFGLINIKNQPKH